MEKLQLYTSIGRQRFIELARAAGATYKINEGTGVTVLINLEIFDNYMEKFRQPARPLKIWYKSNKECYIAAMHSTVCGCFSFL